MRLKKYLMTIKSNLQLLSSSITCIWQKLFYSLLQQKLESKKQLLGEELYVNTSRIGLLAGLMSLMWSSRINFPGNLIGDPQITVHTENQTSLTYREKGEGSVTLLRDRCFFFLLFPLLFMLAWSTGIYLGRGEVLQWIILFVLEIPMNLIVHL